MRIALADSVIIVPMEIESETQLKSENWQAISQQARIERSKIQVMFIMEKLDYSNFKKEDASEISIFWTQETEKQKCRDPEMSR